MAKLSAAGGGGRVTYRTYANVHHFQTRQVGFRDTLGWMQAILRGEAPPSACGAR